MLHKKLVAEWRLLFLKDKLRHIKISRVYLRKHWLDSGSTKPKVVRSALPTGTKREGFYREASSV